ERREPLDVPGGVDDDQTVRGGVRRQHPVLGDERLQDGHECGRVGVRQRDDARRDLVAAVRPGLRRVADGDDLREAPAARVAKPFTCSTDWKTSYASSGVRRVGEMIVTLPRTRSSMMKFRPVTSLTNLARTGISTSWKLSATVASPVA